jgi:L-asparagine transporter-like permease
MNDARLRAFEARIDALESEIKKARNDIHWAIGLMFVVPVGLLIILRVWS